MNIPISKTIFTPAEFDAIRAPLESGWVVQGKFVAEFEKKWSDFTGAKHSIAVSNCTTGLHLSLFALGIKPGDEVLLPAFTWIATANIIESLYAKPVFCDIEPQTFNIDTRQAAKKITAKTRAIIPVHLFGLSADMDPVLAMAKEHNLVVVEDAACGFAGRYKGRHVGTLGDTGCFSFHPRKAITTGEGGMITTNDDALAQKLRALRDHGAAMSDLQRHLGNKPYLLPEFPYAGFNYRMTDLQASIGCTQMNRASDVHQLRSQWAERYDTLIDTVTFLKKPFRNGELVHGFQAYVCMFEPETITPANVFAINTRRNAFMDYLQQKGISTRPGTHAVHMLKYYAEKYNIKSSDYLNSMIADQCSIALPLFPAMTEEEFDYIAEAIRDYKL